MPMRASPSPSQSGTRSHAHETQERERPCFPPLLQLPLCGSRSGTSAAAAAAQLRPRPPAPPWTPNETQRVSSQAGGSEFRAGGKHEGSTSQLTVRCTHTQRPSRLPTHATSLLYHTPGHASLQQGQTRGVARLLHDDQGPHHALHITCGRTKRRTEYKEGRHETG